MSVLASDSFNRANGNLLTSSLDNAAGGSESDTWANNPASLGTWAIASNRATGVNLGLNAIALVAVAAFTADQSVSLKTYSNDCGVIARMADNANGYIFYRHFSTNKGQLFKFVSGVFTQLGSDSAVTIADGDVMKMSIVGTTITCSVNGVSQIALTDATFATGGPGMYGGGGGTSTFEDFLYETGTGGGSVTYAELERGQRGVNRGVCNG